MNIKNSGKYYQFSLDFNKGIAYAEVFDYSDVSGFDGILIRVFNLIDKSPIVPRNLEEIQKSGVKFGPVPINKFPPTKGAWVYLGKDDNFPKSLPYFKELRGLLNKSNWAELSPWFKFKRLDEYFEPVMCDYEDVRSLETMILNHLDSVRVKITMMEIIKSGESVSSHYNLNQIGFKNLYIQIVNTYYSKSKAIELLNILD